MWTNPPLSDGGGAHEAASRVTGVFTERLRESIAALGSASRLSEAAASAAEAAVHAKRQELEQIKRRNTMLRNYVSVCSPLAAGLAMVAADL
jgi:hypothetical protein